jgi:hypothetical protein
MWWWLWELVEIAPHTVNCEIVLAFGGVLSLGFCIALVTCVCAWREAGLKNIFIPLMCFVIILLFLVLPAARLDPLVQHCKSASAQQAQLNNQLQRK